MITGRNLTKDVLMKTGPHNNNNSNAENPTNIRHTAFSKFFGTAMGAFGEQSILHPVDTVAKTAMAKKIPVLPWLRDLVTQQGPVGTVQQLYRAFWLGYGKKAPLRIYKYGFQDELAARLKFMYGEEATAQFGTYGHIMIQTASGGVTGALEPLFFQSIDTLQVRKQVLGEPISIENAKKLGIRGLYKGALVTGLGRNTLGSAGLFGGSEYANHLLDNRDHRSDAKNLAAKWAGAFMSLLFSQPGDMVKTTMQIEQISFFPALNRISWKQMFTNGLGPRLVMSGKVGIGFLLIEKSMEVAKQWFGERVDSPSGDVNVDNLLESKPAMLNQFDSKMSIPTPEVSATPDVTVEEDLANEMNKIRIRD